jgi:DNA-binding GntR family transcriptional regulator
MLTIDEPSIATNRSGKAYAAVKDMIRRRELRGGEIIVEARVAGALNVSRTPLREALQRLEGEGLVVKTANYSFIVRKVDLAEYLNSLNVRLLLEVEAVALAIDRIPREEIEAARREIADLTEAEVFDREAHWRSDNTVHGLIADACGNPVLAQMIRTLRITTNLFEIDAVADRIEPDSTEHLVLLDALESGDVARARRAMRSHINSLKNSATRNMLRAGTVS